MTPYSRLGYIRSLLKTEGINGLILSAEPNVSYAAGFRAPDTYGFVTARGIALVTDFRYAADFKRFARSPVSVRQYERSLFETMARLIVKDKLKKVGFEARHLSFAECEILNQRVGKKITLVPLQKTLEPLREIKDADEVSCIRRALSIAKKTLAFAKTRIKPGRSEAHIAADMERFVRLNGACSMAFETIVASGPNSSYPHARLTDRIMKEGDPVVVDMGVDLNGYKCDLTRTFFLGKINPVVLRAAEVVRQAQALAIRHIRPGITIRSLDAAARNYITQQGFGKNFGHALGHGIGLEVHESPSINKTNSRKLEPGMVFTVEPGIYVPGRFGIRMEEMVLVTQRGVEVLSGNDRD
ncbi:MAG: Xaa-Pro peptidase family protein [Candidatus Omnitrophica bacterium]|nr:Xaa-Pro peptidase family protein [Candidatus Omnitrophota bacterium]